MTGSIICGVDDSESAKRAARAARGLSARLGLRLVFVHVAEDGSSDEKISAIATRLHRLAESATDVDCGAHWLVDVGHPADRLVATAQEENADLIVVGSTGPRSALLGSISADLSRRAPCPVVVVAPGADVSLTNGHDEPQLGFPSLLDDAYAGVAGRIRLGRSASSDDAEARKVAGGIARFSLGGANK